MVVIVVIGVGVFLIFTFMWFYYESTAPAVCGLQKRKLLPDKCMGGCPPGSGMVCINTGDRPYGPFGILGTQHAICNCVPAGWAAGLTPPGTSGSP